MPTPTVYRTQLRGLERLHEGKVRDIYALDAHTMLIVTTDRLSAFDVVLPDPIPDKGRVLNNISNFWFARTAQLVVMADMIFTLTAVIAQPVTGWLLLQRDGLSPREPGAGDSERGRCEGDGDAADAAPRDPAGLRVAAGRADPWRAR